MPKMLTKLEREVQRRLEALDQPVITPYGLFQIMREVYEQRPGFKPRKEFPDQADLGLRRRNLMKANVLMEDPDYGKRAYRITANSDRPAEEICCVVDRFCYIAHLSAMAWYGLTDRRPQSLHLVTAHRHVLQNLLKEAMLEDYGESALETLSKEQTVPLRGVSHPDRVRKRPLAVTTTQHLGDSIPLRGTRARIATIGQTFADMLEHPHLCGGISHVLEVWQQHADLYQDDLIECIDRRPQKLIKVRAGYLLDEYLGLKDSRVEAWHQFAQRGGSQRLDPDREHTGIFSEKWKLALNAD